LNSKNSIQIFYINTDQSIVMVNERKIMQHPYWTKVLALPECGGINQYISTATTADQDTKRDFLQLVTNGFYPISLTSPIAFGRVAKLSTNVKTKRIANIIYEVELGKHPLINGHPYTNITHSEQFRMSIESLAKDNIFIPESEAENLIKNLKIRGCSLIQALATCDVIEHIAPEAISIFKDFYSQWQIATGRKSSDIDTTFFDEHALLEDNKSEEQHIGMVEKLLKPYKKIVENRTYKKKKQTYHERVFKHLDTVYNEIKGSFL